MAVGMAREPEVMHAIMTVLQSPALRVGSTVIGSDGTAIASGSGGGKHLPGLGLGASSPPRTGTGTSSFANNGLDAATTGTSGVRPPVPPPPVSSNRRVLN